MPMTITLSPLRVFVGIMALSVVCGVSTWYGFRAGERAARESRVGVIVPQSEPRPGQPLPPYKPGRRVETLDVTF